MHHWTEFDLLEKQDRRILKAKERKCYLFSHLKVHFADTLKGVISETKIRVTYYSIFTDTLVFPKHESTLIASIT